MESKVEKLKQSKVKVTITVTPAEMLKHFDAAYAEIAPTVKLDGFRGGKAPRALVESTVGVSRILGEALEHAVNDSYMKALIEHKINPFSSPNVAISKYPTYGHTEEEIKDGLEFTAEVTVYPEATIGDYSKIKIEKPKAESVKDEDIEKILDNLKKQKATFKDSEGAAKMGDLAELSFEGSLKHVKIDSMCSKNHPVVLGENTLIPGFEDQVVGMKKGETKEFKIKFPKDYHAKEFAGKEAEFKVELLSLKEVILPEVDEVFAADFGQKDAKSLREAISKNLEIELEKKAEDDLEGKILEKVLPLVKADIPEEMVEREIDRMIEGYTHQLTQMGMTLDSYLTTMKKTQDDLRKDMRVTAEKNIKTGLLLGKIVEEQKIDHSKEDAGKKAIEYLVKTVTK